MTLGYAVFTVLAQRNLPIGVNRNSAQGFCVLAAEQRHLCRELRCEKNLSSGGAKYTWQDDSGNPGKFKTCRPDGAFLSFYSFRSTKRSSLRDFKLLQRLDIYKEVGAAQLLAAERRHLCRFESGITNRPNDTDCKREIPVSDERDWAIMYPKISCKDARPCVSTKHHVFPMAMFRSRKRSSLRDF
jgi:hypothetical protein